MKYNKLYEFYESITKIILRYVKNASTQLSLYQVCNLINTIPIQDEVLEELVDLILYVTNWNEEVLFNNSRRRYRPKTIKDLIKNVKINNSTYDILISPYSSFVHLTSETYKYLCFFNNNKYLTKPIDLLSDLIKYKNITT